MYECFDWVPQIVRVDRAVRRDVASCPLDPLILSTVTRERPISPFDSANMDDRASKAWLAPTLPNVGPNPPSIVPTLTIVVQIHFR